MGRSTIQPREPAGAVAEAVGPHGGAFPRPCLFERLGRVLEKAKPEVVFACYGINEGIYLPPDKERFAAFQKGVTKLIEQCQKAGVKQVFLITRRSTTSPRRPASSTTTR